MSDGPGLTLRVRFTVYYYKSFRPQPISKDLCKEGTKVCQKPAGRWKVLRVRAGASKAPIKNKIKTLSKSSVKRERHKKTDINVISRLCLLKQS